MTEYLKMVPLPSWWQKLDLNELYHRPNLELACNVGCRLFNSESRNYSNNGRSNFDIYTSCEWIAMYGPVQYSTVQYSTVQYITTVIIDNKREPTLQASSKFGLWYTSISISISISTSISISISIYPYPYIQRSYGHMVILPSQIYKRV